MYIKDIKADINNNIEFMKILKYSHYNPTQEKLNIHQNFLLISVLLILISFIIGNA